MNFNDIFKSSFLEQIASFSFTDMIISLVLSFCIGLFIFEIYKRTYKGVMYSRNFGITLIAICMITNLAILTVTSNVVLSLGMVGALSIVRFRTAIKEPMDIAYLFWSIVVGIMLGAGQIPLAVFGSLIVGLVFVLLNYRKENDCPYILVLQCDNEEVEKNAIARLSESVKRYTVKSKTVNADRVEVTVEVRINETSTEFVNALQSIEGVRTATLVSYNGEYMS